jgi:signal transduction histidine kinase/CheY-like chemotaxis protein
MFQTKVLLPVVAVMALMVAFLMWVLNRHFTHRVEPEARESLNSAGAVFRAVLDMRHRGLLARFSTVASEPRSQGTVSTGDAPTVTNFLNTLLNELDLDFAQYTEVSGRVVASVQRGLRADAAELAAKAAPAAQLALQGEANTRTVLADGVLMDLVCVPVSFGAERHVRGAFTFGLPLDHGVLHELKELTRSEIALVAGGRVVLATVNRTEDFDAFVNACRVVLPTATAVPKGPPPPPLALVLSQGEHYFAKADCLPGSAPEDGIGYVLLVSLEEPLRQLRETQRMLLTLSLAGILAGAATVGFLLRRVTRPLRDLRAGAEAVGRGDFSRRVPVTSSDECGELATVFNQMTANLKASREQLEQTVATLKATQAQLVQSEKLSAIGKFIAGVAHELNNPLTSVIGFAELLAQSDIDPRHRRYLEFISGGADRCKHIVQNLLSFARQHKPERKRVDLNELVQSTVKFLSYQLRTSNVAVVEDLASHLPPVLADPHQLQQVFLNLINNARQAMEGFRSDGTLHVTTRTAGGQVQVVFRDNGPGIPPENLLRLFDPFFTTKEVGKGTGLGLSICYGIVQEHGGTIRVESPPGQGATFIVELPPLQPAEAADPPPAPAAPPPVALDGHGRRVLVIDDEPALLEMIDEVLTANGYRVDTAADGDTGLRLLRERRYEVTLCDWKMPGLSGEEVYCRVSASDPEAARRFVFMTGDVVSERTREFLHRSATPCLAKPFSLDDFRAVIRQVSDAV